VFTALITAVITTSLANTNSNDLASVVQHPTVTPKGPALVKARIPKPKLFRTNPHRKAHFLLIDDNNDVFVQDEDLATGYRRRDLTRVEHPDGISEHVRWRLFLARQLALLKYREING
jgi:hypothetical protein